MTSTYLRISTGTSRGRDTYGYTIVRLRDESTGRTFRCMGGGYDMVGTVLADWAVATHQDRLRPLAELAHATVRPGAGYVSRNDTRGLYGMAAYYGEAGELERVSIDGACGVDSVRRILTAAGIGARPTYTRGSTTGFLVEVSDETGANQ